LAAQRATKIIAIVFVPVSDPVATKLVEVSAHRITTEGKGLRLRGTYGRVVKDVRGECA
jgi:hypothetical protein